MNQNEYRCANLSSKPNSLALLTKGCTKSANKPKHLLTMALDAPLNQPAKSIAPQAESVILSRQLCLHIRGINPIARSGQPSPSPLRPAFRVAPIAQICYN